MRFTSCLLSAAVVVNPAYGIRYLLASLPSQGTTQSQVYVRGRSACTRSDLKITQGATLDRAVISINTDPPL